MASPMRLTIEAIGETPVDRTLVGVQGRLIDWSGAWPAVAKGLRNAEKKQFKSEGQYGSGGWATLAASTLASKRARGTDMRILHDSHRLRDSLTVERAREGISRIRGATSFEFGTSVPYAKFHQLGGASRNVRSGAVSPGRAGLPRRRVIQLPEGARVQIVRNLQRHVMGSKAAA